MRRVTKEDFRPRTVSLAFIEGYNAFVHDPYQKENPYHLKSSRAEWDAGWEDARLTDVADSHS